MKRNLTNTAAGAWAAALLCGAGAAWAQGVSEGYINEEVLRGNRGAQQQPYNRGPSAAEVRERHRREARIQSEIAELRRTPFWMALRAKTYWLAESGVFSF